MNNLHRLKTPYLKLLTSILHTNHLQSSKTPSPLCRAPFCITKKPNFFSTSAGTKQKSEKKPTPGFRSVTPTRQASKYHAEAQSALLENLHGTGNLLFSDAEHVCQNCPFFIEKLLQSVDDGQEIVQSLTKLFRYHPINEFEPFFESIGFKPSEVSTILPPKLMFLKDDPLLLENYHALSNYGVPRNLIGKFYKEAPEVLRYAPGVLLSKLKGYEGLGLTAPSVIKVVVSSPSLLIGSVSSDFVKMLDLLKRSGIEFEWIEKGLSDKSFYDWSQMLGFVEFICELGCSKEELRTLMKTNPELLLDENAFLLVVFLLKLGFTREELSAFLLQFPRLQLGIFVKNLKRCFLFLMEVDMDVEDIGNIVREHPLLLGSCNLKKSTSIFATLNAGKKRLCNIIKDDPYQLRNWILGKRVVPLPNSGEDERSMIQKTEFLLRLNFIKNSDEFEKALKVFRGKGSELQERFDCLLKAGVDHKDAVEMIKRAPQVLNQTKEVLEQKLNFLLNEAKFPISSLVTYPFCLVFKSQRVKVRFSMYIWLQGEGLVASELALSTLLACTEAYFIGAYVNRHPKGLEVWEDLKKQHCV